MIHSIIDGSRRRVGLVGANGASVHMQPYGDGHGVKPPYMVPVRMGITTELIFMLNL